MTHPELLRLRDSIDNIDAALIHLGRETAGDLESLGHAQAGLWR